MLNSSFRRTDAPICSYRWRSKPIYYRPGTFDCLIIKNILFPRKGKQEYRVPPQVSPQVILDVGGHIGVASLFFSYHFPKSRIYTFEPDPENFGLLKKNIALYPNIQAFQVALSDRTEKRELFYSKQIVNSGGHSLHSTLNDTTRSISVETYNAKEFLSKQGISSVDLIKIDTEGSEYDVLVNLGDDLIREIKCIMGELHGQKDFELLSYLSRWFRIGLEKRLESSVSIFVALRKDIAL